MWIQLRLTDSFHFVFLGSQFPIHSLSEHTEVLTFSILLLRVEIIFLFLFTANLKVIYFQINVNVLFRLIEIQRIVFSPLPFRTSRRKGKGWCRANL